MMGTSTKRYQWLFLAWFILLLCPYAGYAQSGSFGSTYVPTGGEMAIYGQHNFQTGSGTINAGIIGSERQPAIGLYSFVPSTGSWINASNTAFVDGYVRTYRSDGFTFPIGDNNVYRPAAVSTAGSTSATAATAAYFGVDPGAAVTSDLKGGNYGPLPTGAPFPTSAVATPNLKVDNVEYWDIDGSTSTRITLTWDARTPIASMTNGVLSTLTIVGWNPATAKWEAIPSLFDATSLAQNTSTSSFTGPASTASSGSITTLAAIVPNTYTVYTLAGTANTCPTITNVAANNSNPLACGAANGSIQICGVTAASSYSITYSRDGTTPIGLTQTANVSGCLSLTGLTAGTYSGVRVYDATCATGSNALGPITLSDPGSPPAPTLTVSAASGSVCIGQSLTLTASGASGATYTFSGPGLATPTNNIVVATPPSVGTAVYTVSQSVSGCTSPGASQTVTVTAQPAISNIVTTQPTSCLGSDGGLAFYGLSASTSYTISYRNAGGVATTQTVVTDASGVASLTGLQAGNYTNIIASANGCSSNPQTATLSDPGAPSAPTLSLNLASGNLCIGQSLTLTVSGSSGATFTFSGPGLSTPGSNSVVATPPNVGSAVYMVSQTLAGCTSPMASQTVTVNALPAISSVTPTNPASCSGTNGSLALNGLTPSTTYNVTYDYNGATATQVVVANASGVASLTGLNAGFYTNIIALVNGCNSAPQTATLTDPGTPTAPLLTLSIASGAICLGQSLTLTANGATGATFTFAGPGLSTSTGNTGVATPGSVGSAVYTVSQSVSGCTSAVASQTVTVNVQPAISIVTPTNPTACSATNGSLYLQGLSVATSYTISYNLNGGATVTRTIPTDANGVASLTGLQAGTYSNIIASANGCNSAPQSATLSDPVAPVAPTLSLNPFSGSLCLGQSFTLTASGASGATFAFSGPALSALSSNSAVATPTSVGTAIYTVIQSVSGCMSSATSQTVAVNAQPTISSVTPTNPGSCSGTNGSLALNGLSPSAAYNINYSYNGVVATQVVVANASGVASLTGLSAGSYTNIIALANGCSSAPQTATLSNPTTPAPPVLTLSTASGTLCQGQSLTLTASGASGATYTFSGPGLSTPNGNTVVATPGSVGNAIYTVIQSVSGCSSPAASQTVTVTAQPAITSVTPTNPSSCSGTNGSLALNGLTPSTSYTISYSYNGGTAITRTGLANTSGVASLTGLGAGVYSNIIASANGCSSSAQTATLSDPGSPAAPTLALSPASGSLCLGQSLTLTASGTTGATYTFSGPGLSTPSANSVVATPTGIGSAVYTVSQSVSGCTSVAASQTVTVNDLPTITSVSPTNPTTCGTNTGSLTLNGLSPSTALTVSYSRNGGTPITATLNSNGAGQIVISGLGAGSYTTLMVAQGNCMSAPFSGTVTLTDPTPSPLTAAQVTSINPTSCGSATGRIEITGLPANAGGIVIGYSRNGTPTTATITTDASGKASILNLTAGTYTNFTVQIGACTTAPYAGPVSLSDPGLTPLTAANITNTNPTSCGNNDGRITLSGLPALTTMSITYQVSGTAASANVTTNASGQAVIPNLTAGNYTVIAYTIGGCTSAPYNGTVVINDPGITPLSVANVTAKAPTFCGATNGRVEFTGLASNQSLIINYKKDGVAQPAVTAVTDATGRAIIGSLGQGVYSDFTYSIGSCTSPVYPGPIDIQRPELTAAQVTGFNPAICGANSGRIEITGLAGSQSMTINFTQNGVQQAIFVTSDATGKAIISGLFSGTYTNFSYSQGACTSTVYPGPVILNNPAPTVLTSANVLGINPTRCGQADGRIEITGLAGATSTTVNYKRNGVVQVANVTTDPSGKATLNGLSAGTYSDFTYTQGTCTSAPYIGPVTLTDPTPTPLTSANVTSFNPTSCTATDGRIEITGLASNVTTTFSYSKDGVATSATILTDNSGKAILTNLGTGNYSTFSYSQGTCTSAPYTATLAVSALGCSRISMRVYLQGALFNSGGSLSVTNRPLMRDNLRSGGYLPLSDPYRTATYTSAFRQVNNAEFQTIPASMTTTTGDKAIVDWVFIELRDKSNPAIVSYTRSGLVLRDGTVIDSDGQSSLNFTGIPTDNYYIAVRHRNHLGVMTAQTITIPSSTTVDFTTMTDAQLWNTNGYDGVERSAITAAGISVRALWAGNSVHNNKVKYIGSGTDLPGVLSNVLSYPGSAGAYNFSNAYGYFIGDVNMDGRALYIGSGNDGAFILSNVLNYPLNSAKTYNYDLFFQQLP